MKDVKDLLDDSNYNFLTYTVFISKYNKKTNHLEYYKVVSALKHFRKKCYNNKKIHFFGKSLRQPVLFREGLQKDLSDFTGQKKDFLTSENPQGKWLADDIFFSNVQVNWENTYQQPFLCTTETKLRIFQFKFLRRRVATNDSPS